MNASRYVSLRPVVAFTNLASIARALTLLVATAATPACSSGSGSSPSDPLDDGADDGAVSDDGAPAGGDDDDSVDAPGSDDDGADAPDDGIDAPGDGVDASGDGVDASGPDASGDGPDASGDGGGVADGGGAVPDAAPPDAPEPDAAPVTTEGPYDFLSQSGLYTDMASHTIAPDIMTFEPEFKLWSDGAEKARFIRLPPGAQINTNNMGRWVVPIGTTVWKEFSDPVTLKRLETRIIQRLSSGEFYFASFIWNDDDTEAVFDTTLHPAPPVDIPAGCSECPSPPCASYPTSCHVVPPSNRCIECHAGEASRLLGFSAVQLSHDGPGLTLSELASMGVLSNPPPAGVTFPVPGTAVERNAIGTLHANCGHCHSQFYGQTGCYSLTGLQARVLPGDATPQETSIYETAVDQPLMFWTTPMRGNHTEEQLGELITDRIVSGDASRSAIWYRMSVREWGQLPPNDDHQQMPYFATNEVDAEGLAAVELWINSLP